MYCAPLDANSLFIPYPTWKVYIQILWVCITDIVRYREEDTCTVHIGVYIIACNQNVRMTASVHHLDVELVRLPNQTFLQREIYLDRPTKFQTSGPETDAIQPNKKRKL